MTNTQFEAMLKELRAIREALLAAAPSPVQSESVVSVKPRSKRGRR